MLFSIDSLSPFCVFIYCGFSSNSWFWRLFLANRLKISQSESIGIIVVSKFSMKRILALCLVATLGFESLLFAQSPFTSPDSLLVIQEGIASFYGTRFHNRKTANGEVYDMWEFTAAHKHLPFGTLVKVTNQQNGLEAIVRINDRLPKSSKRIIDLSKGVAKHLEMVNDGVVPVKLSLLSEQAVEWVRDQYKKVPKDIRLRNFHQEIAFTRDDEELLKIENKAY
tara:strand:+ start:14847 stop:15518 length:672 start_codon:yes stop_codon:yes gene_type:complete